MSPLLFKGVCGRVTPRFQRSGTLVSMRQGLGYIIEQELTPNYSPSLEVIALRNHALVIGIIMYVVIIL